MKPVDRQRFGKHASTTIELLLNTVFSTLAVHLRDGGQPAIALAGETEESPLLEAVARIRLVKSEKTASASDF
jgi:hypothetical protein